jgi:hypothetical protein
MTKITTANLETSGQSTQSIVQLAIAAPSGHNEPRVEISHAHRFMAAIPQESTRNTVEPESSIVDLGAAASEQHIEHPVSNTVSGPTPVAEPSHPDGRSNADSSARSATSDPSQSRKISMGAPISRTSAPHIPAELPIKLSEQESITTLPSSPDYSRKQSGPLNLQTTIDTDVVPPSPSIYAIARHIEDIARITYPQGINRPKLELNVNTQKGKFR